jgi:hypothetical protein
MNMRSTIRSASFIFLLSIILSCEPKWAPSDNEAIRLVKDLYLFSHEGKHVEPSIIMREAYSEDCQCYPIKFRILLTNERSFQKTLYFFKNELGNLDVREYRYGLKKL